MTEEIRGNLLVKQFGKLDVEIHGTYEDPLFKAKDIGELLGIKNINSVIRDFGSNEKGMRNTHTLGGSQQTTFLTEQGLYKVLFASRKKIAIEFQNWVFSVIKQIKLTGKFELEEQIKLKDSKILELTQPVSDNYEMLEKISSNSKSNCLIEEYSGKRTFYIGYVSETPEFTIVKYGYTKHIADTLTRHTTSYGYQFHFIFMVETPEMDQLETLVKTHNDLLTRHIKIYEGALRNELLRLDANFNIQDFIFLVNSLNNTLKSDDKLKFEYEKSKQLELSNVIHYETTKQAQETTKQLEFQETTKQMEFQETTKQMEFQETTKQAQETTKQMEEKTKQMEVEFKILSLKQQISETPKISTIEQDKLLEPRQIQEASRPSTPSDTLEDYIIKFINLRIERTRNTKNYIFSDCIYDKFSEWLFSVSSSVIIPLQATFISKLRHIDPRFETVRISIGPRIENSTPRRTGFSCVKYK